MLKEFKFYLKYYLTNHVVNRIPFHCVRLLWYRNFMRIKIGAHSQIWLGCQFLGDSIHEIIIGNHTVLARDVVINASAPVIIGDRVSLASGTRILTTDHDVQKPEFLPQKAPVRIESWVWIATTVIILKGVQVGHGAVLGAGSVVSRDIRPLALIAGNPAREFGTRAPPGAARAPSPHRTSPAVLLIPSPFVNPQTFEAQSGNINGRWWAMAATFYILLSTSLLPLSTEVYITEQLRLFNTGLQPYVDFEWYYGILPFAIYGLPMKLLSDSLIVQRLISATTALAIVWQARSFLKELEIVKGRFIVLTLTVLVSTSQQFSHSHTLVTLSALIIARLLARKGVWQFQQQVAAIAFCLVALTAKPLFGGAAIMVLTPILALWLGRIRIGHLPLFVVSCALGTLSCGMILMNQPFWLSLWYGDLQAGRTKEIVDLRSDWLLSMRIEYLTYFLKNGVDLQKIQTYLQWAFPLLVFDFLIVSSIVALVWGRLSRVAITFLLITCGVSAQVIITSDINLLGYAQEILPLCFVLCGIAIHSMDGTRIGTFFYNVVWIFLLIFALHYSTNLLSTLKRPVGNQGLTMIHLSAEQKKLSNLGNELGHPTSVMSLGDYSLVLPMSQQGTPNYGALYAKFNEAACFQDPTSERAIFDTLITRKPKLLLISNESIEKAPTASSLRWIRGRYDEIPSQNAAVSKAILFRLKKPDPLKDP
jgi:maltose O-acetyltransferase